MLLYLLLMHSTRWWLSLWNILSYLLILVQSLLMLLMSLISSLCLRSSSSSLLIKIHWLHLDAKLFNCKWSLWSGKHLRVLLTLIENPKLQQLCLLNRCLRQELHCQKALLLRVEILSKIRNNEIKVCIWNMRDAS